MRKLMFVLLGLVLLAGLAVPQSVNTSLTVLASNGDNTYCVTTPVSGVKPQVSVTCRRAGVTVLSSAMITGDTSFQVGDLSLDFKFNPVAKTVSFVTVQNRTAGTITWPTLAVLPPTTSGATRILVLH